MTQLQFKQIFNASAQKVYDTLLGITDKTTYEAWTTVFNPTSTYEGQWETGSKIYFIGTDENGNRGGMVSEIAEAIPNQFVSIRHYGILNGTQEITEGPEVEKWAGGLENYSLNEINGVTTLTVDMDATEDYIDFFKTTWPKALDKLKTLVEN